MAAVRTKIKWGRKTEKFRVGGGRGSEIKEGSQRQKAESPNKSKKLKK